MPALLIGKQAFVMRVEARGFTTGGTVHIILQGICHNGQPVPAVKVAVIPPMRRTHDGADVTIVDSSTSSWRSREGFKAGYAGTE